MPYELIYTSAPQGLNHGRSGFCTVARSADMPERLASIVEKFSNFDFGICEKKFSLNKINYSNGFYYVLTRICDCGSDYTNRTNFLAHHLIFNSEEILNFPNPAQIFLSWKGWMDSWNQAPKFLENSFSFENSDTDIPLACETWQEVFGDAGKAAIPREMQYCSFFLECEDTTLLLRLFEESLSLNVDKKTSWDFTFTTYLAQNESAKDYNWKGYIQNPPSEFFIDLKNKICPNSPDSRLAEFARNRVMTKSEKLSLVAGKPQKISSNFKIIEVEKNGNTFSKLIFASVGISMGLFSLIVFLFGDFSFQNEKENFIEKESEREKIPVFTPLPSPALTENMKNAVLELIQKGDYQEALDKWNNFPAKKEINIYSLISENILSFCNSVDAYIATGNFSIRENMTKQKELKKHLTFLNEQKDFPNQNAIKKRIEQLLKTLENF